ncbi:MAG: hypothetical protein K2N58_08170 [Treponemataceae bacterium]|nr:hypothetical protein [Treponemataceae bacterium]
MKNKGISIAAILIICVFVVTIAALGLSVYSAYKVGSENAADRFEKLSSRTMELSGIYPCGSKEFLAAFNDSVNAPNFYEQLRLEVDGIEVYIYPSFPMSTPSTFAKTFSTRIIGGDGEHLALSANIYALSPATIFNRAKIAFIVILGGTLMAGILLVFTYLSEAEEGEKIAESKIDEPIFSDDEATEDDLNLTEEYLDEESLDNFEGENDVEKKSEPKSENENSSSQKASEQNTPTAEENSSAQKSAEQSKSEANKIEVTAEPSDLADDVSQEETPAPIETQSSSEEKNCDEQKNEQGLFSPTSGFGWESYLDTRLGSELIRAASSEQELSLLVIKIPGMTPQSDYYAKVCKTLLDFFQFKDFIFEYKEDGFAAIIQGKGIDEAMESAESLYANLKSTLNKERANARPLIGISSRSLRLISAERLKTEAEQAAEHASTDNESPIVAFRVNPEKYRKFITEQTEE